jgi:hypothetical protein
MLNTNLICFNYLNLVKFLKNEKIFTFIIADN